jgi:ribosome-associated translation inhibitor RaiA
MRIDVGGSELEGRPALRAHVEQRVLSTVGRFACHLESISARGEPVDMRPLKGAFGCQIVARLRGGRELVEEVVANDLCTAIDRAVEALADSVESRLPRVDRQLRASTWVSVDNEGQGEDQSGGAA